MANGDELSLSPDLQGYVTGQNELFPIQQAYIPSEAKVAGFDLAFGDSLAAQQLNNNRMWGVKGPRFDPQNPDIWTTATVGATPYHIDTRIDYLLEQNPDYFKGKNVFLSPGTSNDPRQMNIIDGMLQKLKKAEAANVVVPGVGPGVKNSDAVNKVLERIVTNNGFTYFMPNLTRGWDKEQIHPNDGGEMTSGAISALSQARRAAAPAAPAPAAPSSSQGPLTTVQEGQYGSANLRPGYQRAPSDFNVSTTPGSQEQQPIAPTQYASAGAAPAVDAPTNLVPPEWTSPPLRYNWNPLGAVPPSPLNQPAPPYTAPAAPTPGPSAEPPPAGPNALSLPEVGVTAPANPLAVGLPPVGTNVTPEIWRRAPGDPTPGTTVDPDAGQFVKGTNIPVSIAKQLIRAHEPGPQGYKSAWGLKGGLTGKEEVDEFGFPSEKDYKGGPIGSHLYGGQYAGSVSHAAGMYQVQPATWQRAVEGLRAEGVNVKDFSPESQEKVASWLLRHDGLSHWLPFNYNLRQDYNKYVQSGQLPKDLYAPPGVVGSATTVGGPYMSGDPVQGTNFAIGGRLAFAPPPQMFTGPEAPGGRRPTEGPPVAKTEPGPGPAGMTPEKQAAIDAETQKSRERMEKLKGFQMLALAAALAQPRIPPNTYSPKSALPKEPPPGTGRIPLEPFRPPASVGTKVGGPLAY